jgi:hypothetical protein
MPHQRVLFETPVLTACTATSHPSTMQVSGHGFSRAVTPQNNAPSLRRGPGPDTRGFRVVGWRTRAQQREARIKPSQFGGFIVCLKGKSCDIAFSLMLQGSALTRLFVQLSLLRIHVV